MKKLTAWILALAALSGGLPRAQELAGPWQGTISADNRELRVVLLFTKSEGGFKATLHTLDQGAQSTPATSVLLTGSTLKLAFHSIGAIYEAKTTPDFSSMTGTFTAGGHAIPMTLTHATPETAWALPEPPPRLPPMPADANPSFEVATVKQSRPEETGMSFQPEGRHFSTRNTSVSQLIMWAYGVHARQIVGGASWLDSEKYDIAGVPDKEGQANKQQWQAMLQKLLADRFKLSFHREQRELSAYVLSLAKSGPKMGKSEGDPNAVPLGNLNPAATGGIVLAERNANMGDVGRVLQQMVVDRPVVDRTGLAGRFDFTVTFMPEGNQTEGHMGPMPPPPDGAEPPPSLSKAFQEQLGLKLDPVKTQVDVLVIDHVEKPTAD